ncbi:hypothetical protein [Polyangium aurulentum]|uniref:hypothetical protein n=1 Tax=Polyangium aurulentum TaxID=2567896 RepID=UPI0010ADFB1C|nr:hypothetical protein [Polyangium aurulentum]UQA56824.1 hypothetical protein E8A73_036815 [Polyangium aurulentum]
MEAVGPKNMPYWGVDLLLSDRPGVPREGPQRPLPGAHDLAPQPVESKVLTRADLARPTPVFSTALPPWGLSGLLRRLAYRYPDNLVRHWMLLLLADRVDAIESAVVSIGRRIVRRVASVLSLLGVTRRHLAPAH